MNIGFTCSSTFEIKIASALGYQVGEVMGVIFMVSDVEEAFLSIRVVLDRFALMVVPLGEPTSSAKALTPF